MVVPEALKIMRIRDNRKFCVLGDLAKLVGWNRKDLVESLEEKRKVKANKFYEMKKKKMEARSKAHNSKEVSKFNEELAKYGF